MDHPPPSPLPPDGPEPPEQHARFPSAVGAIWLLIVLMLLEALIATLLGCTSDLPSADRSALVLVLAHGLVFSVLLHHKQLRYAQLFHPGAGSPVATWGVTAPWLLMLTPGLVLLISAAQDLLVQAVPMSPYETEMFQRMDDGTVATVLTACLIAPFLEEMLFRGLVLRSFLQQYARWPAIFGSALLFAVAHMNIYQGLVGLVIGVLTGWLYERTRSLWPSIWLHVIYNSFITWLSSGGGDGSPDAGSAPTPDANDGPLGVPLVVWALALFGLVAGLHRLRRLLAPPSSAGTMHAGDAS